MNQQPAKPNPSPTEAERRSPITLGSTCATLNTEPPRAFQQPRPLRAPKFHDAPGDPRHGLRARALRNLDELGDYERRTADLNRRVGRWIEAVPARRIAIFWPIGRNPDLLDCFSEWAGNNPNRSLSLPVKRGDRYIFAQWQPANPYTRTASGALVPRLLESVTPQLIFVPCLAIDRHRKRLGFGGGTYARTLASAITKPVVAGVTFDVGRIDALPHHPDDISLGLAISEMGVW